MIIKKREVSLSIQKLQALVRRTPRNHPKYPFIQENLSKTMAGYKGETALDYPLSFLQENKYFFLHDLRLKDSKHFFQIDTLVLSQNFILILEVKNIAGALYFDQEFNQLIRTKNGIEKAFPDPLIQVQRQETQLKNWMALNRLPAVPIHSLIIISNPGSIIRTSPQYKSLSQKVLHRDYLPERIRQLEKLYLKNQLSEKELKKWIRQLNKQHEAADHSILERFNVTREQLRKGVHCPACEFIPLARIYGNWHCPNCSLISKDAHLSSLKDYSLLINSEVSSSEVRDFLNISDIHLTSRLLRSAAKESTGKNKGKRYTL
jgi:ribosomal protein L37AE/L43A